MDCFQLNEVGHREMGSNVSFTERLIKFDAWALREYTVFMMKHGCSLETASEAAMETSLSVRLHVLLRNHIEHEWLLHDGGRCK